MQSSVLCDSSVVVHMEVGRPRTEAEQDTQAELGSRIRDNNEVYQLKVVKIITGIWY